MAVSLPSGTLIATSAVSGSKLSPFNSQPSLPLRAELAARFRAVGSMLTEMDTDERLKILHDFYRAGEEQWYRFDLKDAMRKGHDFRDGICPDTLEFRSGYDRRIQERQKAMVQIKEERLLTVENGERHSEWIDLFRQYENITELQRAVVVNLIERIIIYDAKHIEVVFRYQDQLDEAVQYIDRYKDILPEEA